MFSDLTTQQQQILKIYARGYSVKEVAYKKGLTENTINTHIKNIKERLGLQKSTELIASYWCEFFGTSLEEQRKSILSLAGCLIFLFTISLDGFDKRRIRFRSRRDIIESVEVYPII